MFFQFYSRLSDILELKEEVENDYTFNSIVDYLNHCCMFIFSGIQTFNSIVDYLNFKELWTT